VKFRCKICGYLYSRKDTLKDHIRGKHNTRFSTQDLNQLVDTVTPEAGAQLKNGKFHNLPPLPSPPTLVRELVAANIAPELARAVVENAKREPAGSGKRGKNKNNNNEALDKTDVTEVTEVNKEEEQVVEENKEETN